MTVPSASPRDSWATRVGFLLAAIGSAVGLGNMWRFAYKAAEGGGAAFVIVYLVIVAAVGIPLMTSEFVVGRLAQESPARAIRRLGGPAWGWLGWLFVLSGLGILSYYGVIAGWAVRYAVDAVRHAIPADSAAYFGSVSQGVSAAAYLIVFMLATTVVVAGGVKGGLERANLILMPLLFLLLIGLAIWGTTLAGGRAGYAYYLKPEISELFNRDILTAAAGQSFFSLSLGMGALMTYASYLQSRENLAREAAMVALSDFGVAFVSGLVVFPVIFAFGLLDQVGESAVGALFIALPAGFAQLGRLGDFVAMAFFVMLLFAALTSAISLLEVVVAACVDRFRWPRRFAAWMSGIVITVLGLASAFNTTFLGHLDTLVGNFLLLVGGFFTALLVGYWIQDEANTELANGLESAALRSVWTALVRFVAPSVLVVVLYFQLGPAWEALKGLLTYAR